MVMKHRSGTAASCAILLAAALGVAGVPRGAHAADAQSYIAQAKALLAKGDVKGAVIELRNAVREKPDDPSVHVELAQLYLELKNLPAAEAEARLARQDHGDPNAVDPVLAEVLAAEGKVTQLFDIVRPGNRAPKAESKVRLELGLAHLGLREDKAAEPLLRDAERLDETAVGPKIGVARLLMSKGDINDAEAELARARAIAPDDPTTQRLTGEILYAKGDRAGAMTQFGSILAKHPDDLSTLVDRANVLLAVGKLKEAKDDLGHALKVDPKSLVAKFLYALLDAKTGKLKEADDRLTGISEYFSAFPDGYYLSGAVQLALGSYAEAQANLSKYVARNPTFAPARKLLAIIATRQRHWQSVIDTLQPVVDANSADVQAIGLLARAYVAVGKREQALELFQKSAHATENNDRVQTQLALMQMQVGETVQGLTKLHTLATSDKSAGIAGPVLVVAELRSGKATSAADEAEALLKHDDKDVLVRNLLGVARMAQHRYAEAAKIFESIVRENPNLDQAQRNLAKAYIALGRYDDARKIWTEMLKQHPNDVEALMSLAGIAAQAKDDAHADVLLKQAQQAAPKDPSPGIERIGLYAGRKEWKQAARAARDVEGQFPANPSVIAAVAAMRAASGDRAGAADELRKLTQVAPNSAAAYARYAQAQIAAGDQAGGRASLQKALSFAPGNPVLLGSIVDLDYRTKGADAALETARSFAADQPAEAAVLQANVLLRAGRRDDAIALLTKEQKSAPDSRVVGRLAQFIYLSGKQQKAIDLLTAWIKTHEDDVATRQEIANMDLAQHDYDAALKQYQLVVERSPDDPIALNNLAWVYALKGDPRAYALAEQAYNLAPTAERADTLGWILVNRGDAKRGLSYLEQAGAALPQNMTVQYHLAAALRATGATGQARTVLERVIKSGARFDGKADAQKLFNQLQHG
ncbi:MAG TPA: XrtA/PEP-CTERM system TPR-repeat protein PrsT [Stellaceae bacterium]|nr:XrtA/PEP-CTERM system TPR-repeat protein PrsT [Stellaceae bacterium]